MTDDDLLLSAGKVYTHKVKFNANDENYVANVLGFEFERDNNRSGSNWSMTGAPNTHAGTGSMLLRQRRRRLSEYAVSTMAARRR